MVSESLKPLLETKDLWLPVLSGLVARVLAGRTGHRIETTLKERLKWLKDPESEKAFLEAFESGVENYAAARGGVRAARSAARILASCVSEETSGLDAANILDQIFAEKVDRNLLDSVAARKVVALEDALTPSPEIAGELAILVSDYLRPAFRNHRFFTERVGIAEILGILQEIRDSVLAPQADLAKLREEYCRKLAEKLDIVPMQGISPKIQNQTIGIRMEDVFIPVRVTSELEATSHSDIMTRNLLDQVRHGIGKVPTSAVQAFLDESFETGLEWEELLEARIALDPDLMIERMNVSKAFDVAFPELSSYWFEDEFKSTGIKTLKELLTHPRVVVRGDPGSGKSTLIRYVAWAIAKEKTVLIGDELRNRFPIIIRAIEFGEALEKGRADSFEEYMVENAGRFSPIIKHSLASGTALLLIDGLDEVNKPALRARVKERVDDLMADPIFSDNRIVITTRIVGYERSGLTGRFLHFTLSELNNAQIKDFIRKWYGAVAREIPDATNTESESLQLISAVTRNDSILRMARNPLLLTIIALIKWQGRTLPEQRVLLYDAAAQTLIRSWPLTQRRVEFEELFVREWLAPVAFHILSGRTGDLIDEYALMDELSKIMRRLRSMTDMQAKTASREMLDNISEHSGFLLPRATNRDGHTLYGFLHQTFAEYLAAYHMAGRWEDRDLELIDYAHDPYWREVLLLIAGHLGTQRRAKAGAFVRAVKALNSSRYEDFIHRDLLLACRILADGTPVGPADTVEALLSEILSAWHTTPLIALRADIAELFKKLRATEYAEVLARLATTNEAISLNSRVALAEALGPEFLIEPLLKALDDSDSRLSVDAAGLLIAHRRTEALNTAARLAASSDREIRPWALRLLLNAEDPRGIPYLLKELKSHNFVSLIGSESLEKNETLLRILREQLRSNDQKVRFNAAQLLALWGDPVDAEAVLNIATSPHVVPASIIWISDKFLRALEDSTLVRLIKTADEFDRRRVVAELVRRGLQEGTNAFFELQHHSSGSATFYPDPTLSILATRRDPRALELLNTDLKNPDQTVRLMAARMLAKLGNQDGIDSLRRFLTDEDERTCLAAIQGLMGKKKVRVLDHLMRLLRSPNIGVHLEATSTLGKLREPGAAEALASLLDDPRPSVRRTAAELMIARDEAVIVSAMERHLIEFLTDRSEISDSLGISAYQFLKRHLTPRGDVLTSRRAN